MLRWLHAYCTQNNEATLLSMYFHRYLMGQFKTSGVRQVFSSADLTVQLCHSVLNLVSA